MVKAEEKKQYKQLECSVPFATQLWGEDKYNNNKTEHKELREGTHKNGDISSTLKSPGERVAVSVGHGRTCIRNSHPILCMHQTARAGGRGAIRGVSSALRPAFPHHGRLTTGNSITTLALRERVATDAGFHPDPEDLANGDENDGAAILSFLVHLRQESFPSLPSCSESVSPPPPSVPRNQAAGEARPSVRQPSERRTRGENASVVFPVLFALASTISLLTNRPSIIQRRERWRGNDGERNGLHSA